MKPTMSPGFGDDPVGDGGGFFRASLQGLFEEGGIGLEALQFRADGAELRRDKIGERRLESAEALAAELLEDVLVALARERGVDADGLAASGLFSSPAGSAGSGSGSVFARLIFFAMSSGESFR